MNTDNEYTEKLFSYGTLRYEAVQLSTYGRILEGAPDIIRGYRLSQLKIIDPDVISKSGEDIHPILIPTYIKTDQVNGMVFDLTLKELELSDKYEVAEYKRISVELISGIRAWVYAGVE